MRFPKALAAVPALIAALAALAIPGVTNAASAEGAVLAVGALALLAGHGWGLIVVVSSHVSLVGQLCPAVVLRGTIPDGGPFGTTAAVVVLLMAVPTIAAGYAARRHVAAWLAPYTMVLRAHAPRWALAPIRSAPPPRTVA